MANNNLNSARQYFQTKMTGLKRRQKEILQRFSKKLTDKKLEQVRKQIHDL